MRKISAIFLIVLSSLLFTEFAHAIPVEIQKLVAERFPGKKIDSIKRVGSLDLYEVVSDRKIVYVDKDVKFLISGNILDLSSRIDLTRERIREINLIKYDELPFSDAIKIVKGNGKRSISVFTDPNCPSCHALDKEFAKLDDVTIYVFVYGILSEDSLILARDIWCSDRPVVAWNDWMGSKKRPPSAECHTPNERNLLAGRKLNISGTPSIFFADGSRIVGAVESDVIQKKLASVIASPMKVSLAK